MATVSYLAHYDTLLQNATDIISKCDKSLSSILQNASGILSQKATVLLQNTTVIKKAVVTKCNVYYK